MIAKVCAALKIKTDLLFCNMDTLEARKVTNEKVQVCATVNSLQTVGIPQGAMC